MTSSGTHENFARDDAVHGPADRQFGFVFAAFFTLVGVWPMLRGRPLRWWSVLVAVGFLAVALLAPRLLAPLNRAWTWFGLVLPRCVRRGVLCLVSLPTVHPDGVRV